VRLQVMLRGLEWAVGCSAIAYGCARVRNSMFSMLSKFKMRFSRPTKQG